MGRGSLHFHGNATAQMMAVVQYQPADEMMALIDDVLSGCIQTLLKCATLCGFSLTCKLSSPYGV